MSERYQVLTIVYRRLLRLFSPHFQQEFGEEMVAVFQEQLDAAAANGRLVSGRFPGNVWGGDDGRFPTNTYRRPQ